MADNHTERRTCELRLILAGPGGIHTWYDTDTGLKRQLVLSGHIDDPYRTPLGDIDEFGEGNSAFHGKQVRVVISSPPDTEWLRDNIALQGVDNMIGGVIIKADVEPEQFELDGETVEIEPVEVTLTVEADAFNALHHQASEAYNRRLIVWAKATLVGKFLPEPNNRLGRIYLKDLDVSTDSEHAIAGFEIFDTIYTDRLRGRVQQIGRDRGEGHGTHISILLSEARYFINAERALAHSISCEGRVINARSNPYDNAGVTVQFDEHELNSREELPERAFFGRFGYWPERPDEEHASTHFDFTLRYLPEDTRDLLIPLLSQEVGTDVFLTVNLTNEEAELLSATEAVYGDVRHYSFEVRRRLIHYDAILQRLEEARERLEKRTFEDEARFSSGKGISEEGFQRIRRSLLAGWRVPDMELHRLSFEQIDALANELG